MKFMSRKEIFQAAVAKGEKPPIAPLTREEIIMAAHAEREERGGSGGGDSGVFYVTLNLEMDTTLQAMISGVCDKTYSEIKNALESAKPIVCVVVQKDYSREYNEEADEEILVHTGYTNDISVRTMWTPGNNRILFSPAGIYSGCIYMDESNTVFMESPE